MLFSPLLRWALGASAVIASMYLIATAVLLVLFYGVSDFEDRVAADWRRIFAARAVETGGSLTQEFQALYGPVADPSQAAKNIKIAQARRLARGEPLVLDYVLARYAAEELGAVDSRLLPSGVYVGTVMIGPERWPLRLLSHYLIYPRHGYVLVVPHDGSPAVQAVASLEHEFEFLDRPDGDLFAVVAPFEPGLYGFPGPGEVVSDLLPVTTDPLATERVLARLLWAASRLDSTRPEYRLFASNSNTAVRCFLLSAGVSRDDMAKIVEDPVARLRLWGIGQNLWSSPREAPLEECVG